MGLVLTRVDSRLIHVTVIENWANHLRATAIVVASDEIMANGLSRAVLEMAVPSSIRVGIYNVRVATSKIMDGDFEKDRVMLLFANVLDACRSIRYGLKITSLNLGDYQSEDCMVRLSDRVVLGIEDVSSLKSFLLDGIFIYAQSLPGSKQTDVNKILKEGALKLKK